MKNKLLYFGLFFVVPVILVFVLFNFFSQNNLENTPTSKVADVTQKVEPKKEVVLNTPTTTPKRVVLAVPYESEAPEGIWTQPWANACEEASIMMIDRFYKGQKSASVYDAKIYLRSLFAEEEALFGTSKNASGLQIVKLINTDTSFHATLKDNPTIDDIKAEIIAGRPMISMHYGFGLKNPNIGFVPTGSSYHTMVIVGFDDDKQVFITNDPGDEVNGPNHVYGYTLFMNSLHDYNLKVSKANGVARVVMTSAD